MAINGISGNAVSPQPQSTASTPAASGSDATSTDSTPAGTQPKKHDTVELTGTALARSLKLSGLNPAQIALKMGLDVKTVDSYLGIKAASASQTNPAPQVAQVPATGQKATATKK